MTTGPLHLVLVVADDPTTCMIAEAALEGAGHAVVTAADGAGALEICGVALPDCVVLDVAVPAADGFDACAAIRLLPGGDTVPILLLTGAR